ncbi:MAG TPA: zf-HC2 domain-containing protein [Candidatus Hypogeohydataceae bacterium YC41]
MRCQDYRKYLSPYLDSELDARTCADIAEHLSVCLACSRFFAQEQEVERQLVKSFQKEKMPEESWRTVLGRINAYDSPRPRRFRLAWLVPAVVVPTAVMVVMLIFLLGKAPDNTNSLAEALQDRHGKYLSKEISIGPGLTWPQGFEGLTVIKHLPQSGLMGAHEVRLIGSQSCYIKDIECAHVMYSCCNTPVSLFILRKEDMSGLKSAQRLLDKGKGSAVVNLGNTRLVMKDLREVVVCCISSHDTGELLTAFERL